MSGPSASGTTTTTTQAGPPQQYLNAYSNVTNQAQNVASTPYSSYPGNLVAPLSPDQYSGITATENAQGIANPFINAAAQEIGNSTTPIWNSSLPQLSTSTLNGLATNAINDSNASLTALNNVPGYNVAAYESPYTQQVLKTTMAAENNQDAQQQAGVTGNAISQGAFGGDRSGVAAALTAGQQAIANNATNAGIEQQGFQQAQQESNVQQQLGLQQATTQAQLDQAAANQQYGIFAGQQGAEIGANEANDWLSSQAGYGLANLGSEAESTALGGANALLGVGGLEQQQAQEGLNVPYEQYLAAQAYPFQTTGWLANIDEGLGGASGGTGTTTSPAASVGSQIAGGALAGLGALNYTGAFGSNGYLTGSNGLFSNLFPSSAALTPLGDTASDAANVAATASAAFGGIARGGVVPHRAGGGGIVPNVDISIVPGASGFGDIPASHGGFNLNTSTGSTTTTSGGGSSGSGFGGIVGDLLPLAGIAAHFLPAAAAGGRIGHRAGGGIVPDSAYAFGGNVMPFPRLPHAPMHLPSGGRGIVSNDNHVPSPFHTPHLATGGVAIPQLATGTGGMSTPSAGGVSIPQLGGGGGGIVPGGSASPVQSYLNAVAATAYQPPVAAPASAASPAASAPASSAIPVTSLQQFSNLGIGDDPTLVAQINAAAAAGQPTATVTENGQQYSVPVSAGWTGISGPGQNNGGPGGTQARGGVVGGRSGGGIVGYDDGGFVTSPAWMDDTMAQESGGDPEAHNPRSSAYGLGQFTDGTWMDEVGRTNPAWAQGKSRNEILGMRSQPGPTRDMMGALNADNARALAARRLPVNDATVRLAYGFGAGGAHALLTADPSTPAGSVLGDAVIKANPELASKTVGDVLASRGLGGGGGGIAMMPTMTEAAPSGGGIVPSGDIAYHAPQVDNSPWKALMYAGLGIMGGNSPQAGVNIGRGALQGVQAAEREHATDVAQAGNEAEREFTAQMSNRRENETSRHNQVDEQTAAQRLVQQAQQIAQAQKNEDARTNIERDRLTNEAQHQQATEEQGRWVSGTGPLDGGGTGPGMYFVPKGGGTPVFHPGVNTTQQANSDIRKQVFEETVKQHGIQNDQRAQAATQAQIGRMTDEALRIYAGSKDLATGKYTMTPEQAEQQATDIRTKMSGAQQSATTPAAPAANLQDPLGIRQ